jgi:anti-sigma factor RsiW
MPRETEPPLTAADLADLSALADGTLPAERRRAVEERIAASEELRALYGRERDVVARLQTVGQAERAPAHLRRALEDRSPARRRPRTRRRLALPAGALAVGLAAAVVLALVLPSGAPAGPTIADAAGLAARGAVAPVIPPAGRGPVRLLAEHVGALHFPASLGLGFRAVGERSDRVRGRLIVTVYYASAGARLAYAIVGAPVLARPAGTTPWTRYALLRRAGRAVLTWRFRGHTCVISAPAADLAVERQLIAVLSLRD